MKDLSELVYPADLLYTASHEWSARVGDLVRVGITDFAQDQLGDVVYVELPAPGARFGAGEELGTVESVKAVSALYLPFAGEVVEVNGALEDAPQLVNESPYGDGWLVLARPEAPGWAEPLLSAEAYRATLESGGGPG
ncbi:MAG: glycine cleavage system protein GcvH [Deferrisomatales bacterium]